jgi:hypothetical protein
MLQYEHISLSSQFLLQDSQNNITKKLSSAIDKIRPSHSTNTQSNTYSHLHDGIHNNYTSNFIMFCCK